MVRLILCLNLGRLLQLAGIFDAKPMLEDLLDILECHALDLRVAEVDGDPTEEADGGVEAKGARRRGIFHLGEEGGGDNDVGAPASTSQLD